jgi:hypothetical protein
LLEKFGIQTGKDPDFQFAVAGRWNPQNASLVGASMLLATQSGGTFDVGAFSTTHDNKTGARIMAYDDGVKVCNLPGDLKNAVGRTDILGRKAVSDCGLYQMLGSLASHQQYGGELSPVMDYFQDRVEQVLGRYRLHEVIHQSAWINEHARKGDSPENHAEMVNTLGRAWLESYLKFQKYGSLEGTVVGDISAVIAQTAIKIAGQRKLTADEKKAEVKRLIAV